LLQFDATGEKQFLEIGRKNTFQRMATHVSHMGVHDHGFNNISTYGNLWRLMREAKIPFNEREQDFYELALKISGAIQAARWTRTGNAKGYIYSFNGRIPCLSIPFGPGSLAVAHQLGHVLMGECDQKISLLQRLIEHADTTARYAIYYGEGRDAYDVPGRPHTRASSTQTMAVTVPQLTAGYSPFSTWTRGLAWAILGYAEELEFLGTLRPRDIGRLHPSVSLVNAETTFLRAATATAEFLYKNSCSDGIPIWDTGAPNVHRSVIA